MIKTWIGLWGLCIASASELSLKENTFSNDYNHYSGGSISRLKIYGERCSGTNFTKQLLHRNFPDLQELPPQKFCHKHFLWWLNKPISRGMLGQLKLSFQDVKFSNSANCLFVVVIRDPYDWLRSFYLTPYCVHSSISQQGFFHFISSEWKLTDIYPDSEGRHDKIDNVNPWTGKPFSNVLELRKYKTLNYLKLVSVVDNFLFVRYEDIRDNPEGFINFVSTVYNVKKTDKFIPIDTDKGFDLPYVRKIYFPILSPELTFINSQLDWEVENRVGYFKKEEVAR